MVKNDSKYWERRKADLIYRQMDKAESKADDIDKIYDEAQRYLNRQANKVFDKFQRDYGLSEKDARRVIKDMNGKHSLSEMRKVLEARPNDPNITQLLVDLDSAAYAFRIRQFENLNKQVDKLHLAVYHAEKRQSDKFYTDFMKDSYNRATFELQQQAGLAYSFNALPEAEILRLRALKWSGDNYSGRIWNNTDELARKLKDEFLVGFMTGRSDRDVVNLISDRFDVGRNNARRLVRTESAFFHNEMEALSYEEADIEYYRFIAVLDKRTSAICRDQDNNVYKVSERKTGVNYPPLHPWCRSTTVAHFDDVELSDLERRARDPKTGKTRLVPAGMSYDDWYDKYVAKGQSKVYNLSMGDGTAEYYSKQLLDRISKVEPKITSDMQRIADNNKLAGLEFRKKTSESLARKIATDSKIENISLSEAADNINDALRYTTIFDSDTFAKEYSEMKQKLIAEGYKIVKVKNTWLTDGPYKGVNTVVKKDGINFEMQYHTQESFDLKNGPLHELYEKRRLPSTTKAERHRLDTEMVKLSKALKVPKNIERVK